MKASVSRSGPLYQTEITIRQHTLHADVPDVLNGRSVGGGDTGPTPHELFLASLASCTAMTVEMYARMKGWDLQHIAVDVTEDTTPDPADPTKQIPRLNKVITIKGNLDATQQGKLQQIADNCPVNKLITGPKVVQSALTLSP